MSYYSLQRTRLLALVLRVAFPLSSPLMLGASATVSAQAVGPGPAALDKAVACYNPTTGEIIVSVNDVDQWFIESASFSLTGAAPNFPPNSDPFNLDNDERIGQGVAFSQNAFTFIDHNLGPVATTGLDVSDLTLFFVGIFNNPREHVPVMLCVPEPTGVELTLAAALGLLAGRRRAFPEAATCAEVKAA